jgi:predicted ATP-binding protein involved in virulence
MQIDSLKLTNFRAFSELEIEFSPNFNILVGDNMTGKTSILEALSIATASFFLGIDGVDTRHIQKEDIRLQFFGENKEYQIPVVVEADGQVNNETLSWKRELNNAKGRTTYIYAKNIKKIASTLQKKVRQGKETVDLPLIAYFPVAADIKTAELSQLDIYNFGSRLSAYQSALNATQNYKNFALWFKTISIANVQDPIHRGKLEIINQAIQQCFEECEKITFDMNFGEVVLELCDQRKIPFSRLSSGFKKVMSIIVDLAFRCIRLNPHKGKEAFLTDGIVIIDEIDVHLHPSWQRKIVDNLKGIFPNVQFFVTTHSPHVISSASKGEVISLPKYSDLEIDGNTKVTALSESFKGWQLDYILKDIMKSPLAGNELDINPLLEKLDDAFETKNETEFEKVLKQLESLLHPEDPILKVYQIKLATFPIL